MKSKLFQFIFVVAFVFSLPFIANAQYLTTDLVLLKVGYVPIYTVSFDEDNADDSENKGIAVQGEYNLNSGNFWLGFGFEYQRMVNDDEDDYINHFLLPMVSAKFVATGGLYVGAGLAGKYLVSAETPSGAEEPDKKIDLWVNGIMGYHLPIAEAVFLDIEGRFGWNITNQQFDESSKEVSNAYDLGFYIGIGTRAMASEL